MPYASHSAKCRSYPGTGHRNLTGWSTQRGPSVVPFRRLKTSASCMIDRLALSPATSCAAGTPSSGAKISRTSVRPCVPP